MDKQILYYIISTFLLVSCLEKEPAISEKIPEINLSTAYPLSNTEVDITGNVLANQLIDEVEYGVVWSETTNPTIENQKITINKINRGTRFTTKIKSLKPNTKIFIKAYVKNISNEVNYSNEIEVQVEASKFWRRLGDLPFEEGQFTGVPIKLDGDQLTFLRLNQDNEWEQYKHYNGLWYDPAFTWEKQKYSFPQFSPRQDPLYFNLNLSKDYTRPTAFLGGGYAVSPTAPNSKIYLKDFYWVFDVQNFLQPLPFADGPIAHFSLNRNEYLLEENNTNHFWSYFSIEEFIKKKPFPNLGQGYDLIGQSTPTKGYILAQKLDETETLLFEYDDATDSWTKKTNFPGKGRLEASFFNHNGKIYYGLGRSTKPVKGLSDIWVYDPTTDKWNYLTDYPGAGNIKVVSSNLGEYVLLFCGYQVRSSDVGTEKYFNANDTWMLTLDK
jgi:hypothetical protein